MKKTFLYLFYVLFVSAVFAQEENQVQALPKLVDLGAKKCIPCKKMAPILDELTVEYKGVFDVEFIDVWQKENSEKAVQYKVNQIPTQVFLDKDGKELARHVGFMSREDILAQWKKLGYNFKPEAPVPEDNSK